jgi:hypothetical protein
VRERKNVPNAKCCITRSWTKCSKKRRKSGSSWKKPESFFFKLGQGAGERETAGRI